jgi:lysophospholipase L1-like esterase
MTAQAKQRISVVHRQGEKRRRVKGWREMACLVPVAVPFWLVACGASQDGTEPVGGGASMPNTGSESAPPNTGSPSTAPSMDSPASGGTEGSVGATPPSSEQPDLTPMLDAPTEPVGSGSGGQEPAEGEEPSTEPPSSEEPPAEEPPTEPPPSDTPALAADDVLLIGDSYFEIPNQEFNRELSRLGREAGMIGPDEIFRDRAISGTRLAGGFSPIPQQYANAQQQAPARVVIMDGGGNDIIQSQCADCAGVTNAIAAADALLEQMAEDGTVEQIIFFYYPDFPNFPALRADAMDFMRPRLQAICEASSVPCEFLDLRPIFVDHPEFTGPDNLHPSVAGSRATAQAVFAILETTPVAQ